MSQSFTNLIYHIVFSTKDRRPLITPAYEPRLYEYIGGIIKGTGGISLGINGADDHVHVLAKLRPDRALFDVLRDLKSNARLTWGSRPMLYACTRYRGLRKRLLHEPGTTTRRERAAARLFRCFLRSRKEKKLAHLAHRVA